MHITSKLHIIFELNLHIKSIQSNLIKYISMQDHVKVKDVLKDLPIGSG